MPQPPFGLAWQGRGGSADIRQVRGSEGQSGLKYEEGRTRNRAVIISRRSAFPHRMNVLHRSPLQAATKQPHGMIARDELKVRADVVVWGAAPVYLFEEASPHSTRNIAPRPRFASCTTLIAHAVR